MSQHPIRETFQSSYINTEDKIGKKFKIKALVWVKQENCLNPEPMFDIEFEDGSELQAHAEEIFHDWFVRPSTIYYV